MRTSVAAGLNLALPQLRFSTFGIPYSNVLGASGVSEFKLGNSNCGRTLRVFLGVGGEFVFAFF